MWNKFSKAGKKEGGELGPLGVTILKTYFSDSKLVVLVTKRVTQLVYIATHFL